MEDLGKQQMLLLTLLLSFVTSIATGIITVSLLNDAPVEVRQTINRVVERTVETVVPNDIKPQDKTVTVRETVVVTEDEKIVEAVEKNKNSLVRIKRPSDGAVIAIGVVLTKEGLILTSNQGFRENEILRFFNQHQSR